MKYMFGLLSIAGALTVSAVARPQSIGPTTGSSGERYWNFDGRDAGDCHLNKGRLTIYPDGHGTWDARLYTRHTNGTDIWHAEIHFNDASNHASGNLPNWDSPGMQGSPSPEVGWHVDFNFDAPAFNGWYYAVPIFNC